MSANLRENSERRYYAGQRAVSAENQSNLAERAERLSASETAREATQWARLRQASLSASHAALRAVLAVSCPLHGVEAGESCHEFGGRRNACGQRRSRALGAGR